MGRQLETVLNKLDQLSVEELSRLRDAVNSTWVEKVREAASKRGASEAFAEQTHGAVTYRQQLVRCGRPCHCQEGKLHGPYWYAFWRDGERKRSKYIGKQLKRIETLERARR